MVKFFIILVIALTLEAVGVVFLSKGMKEIQEVQQYNLAEVWRVVCEAFGSRYFWLGLLFETIFFVLLLVMLHTWDVSLVWPLTALGFVFTTLSAKLIAGEQISLTRWVGVFLIMAGAALVGYSEKLKKPPHSSPAATGQSSP